MPQPETEALSEIMQRGRTPGKREMFVEFELSEVALYLAVLKMQQ